MIEPTAGPSAQTWEQDVSIGGEDVDSNPAPLAQAVSVQGIVTVRDVPTLRAAAGLIVVPTNTTVRIVGYQPQRRRLIITVVNVTGAIGSQVGVIATDENTVTNSVGLLMMRNYTTVLHTSSEVWFHNTSGNDASVSYWAEIDQG